MRTLFKTLIAALFAACLHSHAETNPIFKDVFTADPAPMVYDDTVYVNRTAASERSGPTDVAIAIHGVTK